MKRVKLIFSLLAVVLLMPSCENDGGDSKLTLIEGAAPNVQKIENTDSFINLVAINEGASINLGVTIDKALGDVVSMDVVLFYFKGTGEVYKGTLASNVTDFPATFNITQTEIFAAFEEINDPSDFEIGDQLTVTTDLTLEDGRVIKMISDEGTPNFGANVGNTAAFTVLQTYNVSCPSDLGGVYEYSTTNSSAPTGEFSAGPDTGTVEFTDLGGGVYEISDASFGGWEGLYGPGNIATGVTLTDICNQISYTGVDQYGEVFTFSNLVVNGNQMSFHWENDYGEFGDTTLTRTDGTDWPDLFL